MTPSPRANKRARIAAIGALALLGACGELKENAYPTLAAARENGALSRGWVPGRIPRTARDIREQHHLDTNRSMVAARFDGREDLDLTGCRQAGPWELEPPPFRTRWWPRDVPGSSISAQRHRYYACPDGGFMAISRADGEWLYWRP